jgi:hypothetical protein
MSTTASSSAPAYAVEAAFRCRTDLHDAFTHNARLLFTLQLRFDIEDIHAAAREALVDGPGDKKCDLVYVDERLGVLVVAQGYEAQDAGKGAVASTNKAMDLNTAATWLFTGDLAGMPELLQSAAREARRAIGDGEVRSVQFWYVHNRPESDQVKAELKTVEHAIRNALRGMFGYDPARVPQEVMALEVGMGTQEEWYRCLSAPILVTDTITFDVPGVFPVAGDNWQAVVTALKAETLYDLFHTHGTHLFSANYRDYLGSSGGKRRNDINALIRNSAGTTPQKFWVFNNGVSAIVNDFKTEPANGGARLTVVGISIVNGAQTTGAIGSLEKRPDPATLVPIRFIRCSDADTIADIIRFNNSQNPLLPADYKSNDEVQKRLRAEFLVIPASKYTGGRRGLPGDRIAPPGQLMPTDSCAQALAAFHQRPDIAYHHKADIWQDDELYQQYFGRHTTARHLVFAYALLKSVEERKKLLRDKSKANSLIEEERKQFVFLTNRGAPLLLAAAVARSIETILGKPVANLWHLVFDTTVSPVRGIALWAPIVEVLNPFCSRLQASATSGVRDPNQIRKDIDAFCEFVEAAKGTLRPAFDTFGAAVKIV